jgi:hypothetical protein
VPVRESGDHFNAFVALAALTAALGATNAAAQAQERAPAPDVAQACIYQPNIDHTRILDDRNILFFMRDDVTYQNTLADQCYALKVVNRFTYGEAPMHRLCKGNLITVLQDLTPGGVSRNNLCKLGAFVPVDPDVVDDLIAAAEPSRKNKDGDRRQAIKVVPAELPPSARQSQPASTDASAPPSPPEATPLTEPTAPAEPDR